MKIEIDTNNLAALERLESDLDIALGSVRHAITKLKEKGANRAPIQGPIQRSEEPRPVLRIPRRATNAFAAAMVSLPSEFSTRELFEATNASHPHTGRIGILNALRNAVTSGNLEQIQPGSGRRPARYRKVNHA